MKSICLRSICLFGAAGTLFAATALAQTLSTGEFVSKVAQSDMLEIQASEFVAPNADADTKPFAEMMIKDHRATSNELKELVQSHKVPAELPAAMDAEHQKKLDDLKKLSGRDLDRQYDQMQLEAHQQAVDLFTRYSASGDNSELKAWATKTLPRLKEHLAMAQKLDQGRPSPTVGSAPERSSAGPRAGAVGVALARLSRRALLASAAGGGIAAAAGGGFVLGRESDSEPASAADEATVCCSPAVGPRVRSTEASPLASVGVEAALTLPPPSTVQSIFTPAIGFPNESVTFTTKGWGNTAPTGPC